MRQFRSLPQRLGRANLVAQPVHLEDELLREPARLIGGHARERGSNESFNDPGYPIGDASIIGNRPLPHFGSFNSRFGFCCSRPLRAVGDARPNHPITRPTRTAQRAVICRIRAFFTVGRPD
ncbi:hypothetical protein [Burkholderia multivorans]|uniref:hypothetical protein n=1 Tax=Burkholderia multivorans TaxID=87883 RepID=UPI001C213043|nr:hypothetical protein [Burkholderia multivorans]